jgi:hypothetical protein
LNSGILIPGSLGRAGISPSGRFSISLSGMNGAMPGCGAVGILGILGMLGIVGELLLVMKGMEGK